MIKNITEDNIDRYMECEYLLDQHSHDPHEYHEYNNLLKKSNYLCMPSDRIKEEIQFESDDFDSKYLREHDNVMPKQEKKITSKVLRYHVTITVDPNKYEGFQKQLDVLIIRIIRLAGRQYRCLSMLGCIELTQKGVPHAHLYVHTDKTLDSGKLKSSFSKDMFKKDLVNNEQAFIDYIKKVDSKINKEELINKKIKFPVFSISFKDYAIQEISEESTL